MSISFCAHTGHLSTTVAITGCKSRSRVSEARRDWVNREGKGTYASSWPRDGDLASADLVVVGVAVNGG